MPISINNNDSFEHENDSWLKIQELEKHLKSFTEIYYNQCENQSVRDKTTFFSLENEAVYNRENIQNSSLIKKFGYAQYESYNEYENEIVFKNSFDNETFHLRDKTDSTCNNMRNYIIKEKDQAVKCRVLEKYPDYSIGELVVSKLRFNQLVELEKLLYNKDIGNIQIDYKPNQTASDMVLTSAHLHASFSNTESRKKIASRNGYRFFLDLCDFITINLQLPYYHNAYYRFNGFNSWCYRGFNTLNQREISLNSHGVGTGSQRYYNMNDCSFVRMNHGNGKLLKTIENRAFTIYRDLDKTLEALRMYKNGLNKFLKFYEDISADQMIHDDFYLRIDNKAHRFKTLINPKNSLNEMDLTQDKLRENNGISLSEIRDQQIRGNM